MVGPELPSDSLIQASHQAARKVLPVHRSAVQTGPKYFRYLPVNTGFIRAGHEVGQAVAGHHGHPVPVRGNRREIPL